MGPSFLQLPREIRDKIYDLLVDDMSAGELAILELPKGSPRSASFTKVPQSKLWLVRSIKPLFFGLEGSCRQIRDEVHEYLRSRRYAKKPEAMNKLHLILWRNRTDPDTTHMAASLRLRRLPTLAIRRMSRIDIKVDCRFTDEALVPCSIIPNGYPFLFDTLLCILYSLFDLGGELNGKNIIPLYVENLAVSYNRTKDWTSQEMRAETDWRSQSLKRMYPRNYFWTLVKKVAKTGVLTGKLGSLEIEFSLLKRQIEFSAPKKSDRALANFWQNWRENNREFWHD